VVAAGWGRGVAHAGRVLEPFRLFAVALQFLTRLPLPRLEFQRDDLRRASALFPLVGAVVAGVGIGLRAALEPLWGEGVATVAALVAMIAVTGALHEDGLADTADGLWGGWDPARRLAIMRDSRIGTYGAVALIMTLGLRASLLLPLGLADFARAVACGHVLGRASTLLLVRLLPVATPPAARGEAAGEAAAGDETLAGKDAAVGEAAVGEAAAGDETLAGKDAAVREAAAGNEALAGNEVAGNGGEAVRPLRPRLAAAVVGPLSLRGALAAVIVVVLTVLLATRLWAAVPLAAGLLICLLCADLFRRRLGGITGDTLGAANQLVELAAIAAVAALARAGLL
jgi:adenosylcobinamide-GDP ribazoletransferase